MLDQTCCFFGSTHLEPIDYVVVVHDLGVVKTWKRCSEKLQRCEYIAVMGEVQEINSVGTCATGTAEPFAGLHG